MASRAGRRRAREDHRRRRSEVPLSGARSSEVRDGRSYVVQQVTGSAAGKDYRCPGCARTVPAGTPHVVVWPTEVRWPEESGPSVRRHWHAACWSRGLTGPR